MPREQLLQFRRGSAAAWAATDPVLAAGEVGHDVTNNALRVGNGTAKFSELIPIGTVDYNQVEDIATTALTEYLAENPIEGGTTVLVEPHPTFPGVGVIRVGGTAGVPTAPAVTSHPASTTVDDGETASFTAIATGSPFPTRQWQRSTNGGSTWVDIAGATGGTYVTPVLTIASNAYQYRCVFTNSAGTAISNAATVTVNAVVAEAPYVVYMSPARVVQSGQTATLEVLVGGSPAPTYQWQDGGQFGSTWTNIPGATNSTYTTPALTASRQYRCVVTNSQGTLISPPMGIDVFTSVTSPTVAVPYPTGVTAAAGQPALIAGGQVGGSAATTTQWQTRATSGDAWVNVAGGTVRGSGTTYPEYLTPTLSAGDNGRQYRATFTNGSGAVTTDPITVTIAAAAAPAYTAKFSSTGGLGEFDLARNSSGVGARYTLDLNFTGNPMPLTEQLRFAMRVNAGAWLPMGGYDDRYLAGGTGASDAYYPVIFPVAIPDTATTFEVRVIATTPSGTTTFTTGARTLTGDN